MHAEKNASERRIAIQDALRRRARFQDSLDRKCCDLLAASGPDGELIAVAYFKRMPGNVVMLGGLRFLGETSSLAAKIISRLTDCLAVGGYRQIQAVLESDDERSRQVIEQSGFRRLARLKHIALELDSHANRTSRTIKKLGKRVHFFSATRYSKSRFADLIQRTFENTLDCPALNALRTKDEVIDSFLDGRSFRRIQDWFVAESEGRAVGCLLLDQHPEEVLELVYMGLVSSARGRGHGMAVLDQVISFAQRAKQRFVVAAVDEANAPALKLYARTGFIAHRQFDAWFFDQEDKMTRS